MHVDLVQRLVDVARLVTDDFHADVGGQLRLHLGELGLHAFDHGHGIRARLAAHVEAHGRHAVQARERARLLRAVLGPAHVAHPDGRTVPRRHHQIVEGARVGNAAQRAERLLAHRRGDESARHVRVLALDRVAHFSDGNLIRGQPVGIDPHVDGAQQFAHDFHLGHACAAFDLHLHELVGDLAEFAPRALAHDREREHGRQVVVGLCDHGRIGVARQQARDAGHALAHVLRRSLDVTAQIERDQHKGTARPVDGTQFLDARDGVDGLLDGLGNLGLNFGGRSPGQSCHHAHGGQIHGGKTIHAEIGVTRRPDHDEGQDQH